MPLVPVLARIERQGCACGCQLLGVQSVELGNKMAWSWSVRHLPSRVRN